MEYSEQLICPCYLDKFIELSQPVLWFFKFLCFFLVVQGNDLHLYIIKLYYILNSNYRIRTKLKILALQWDQLHKDANKVSLNRIPIAVSSWKIERKQTGWWFSLFQLNNIYPIRIDIKKHYIQQSFYILPANFSAYRLWN